jgi:aminoglycoside phosphotransferase (APT) family kinase protein
MPDEDLLTRLDAILRRTRPGASRVETLEPLPGGVSSLTYLASVRSGERTDWMVVKSAPPGLAPVRNRDVLRQARILRALAAADGVPVPAVLFGDPGDPPVVPPVFAMTFVAGESIEPNLDRDVDGRLPEPDVLAARAHHAAKILARLHQVAPAEVGLDNEPVITATDEVDRWAGALATIDPELMGGSDDSADILRATAPPPVPSSLIHGDFRLGNCLSNGPAVLALIDWEIWARSDPRIDLAWFLLTADSEHHPNALRRAPGMPGPHELLATYRSAGGEATGDIDWFTGLMLYKWVVVSGLIAKNAIKRGDTDGIGARAKHTLPEMFQRARKFIRG